MKRVLACCLACVAGLTATGCSSGKNNLAPAPSGAVTLTAPTPVRPLSGERVGYLDQPLTLTLENATTTGPAALAYLFELSTDAAFASTVFTRTEPQGAGRTSVSPADRVAVGNYVWRARAQDGSVPGPYTAVQSFEVLPEGGHRAPAELTEELAEAIIFGCGDEFPELLAVFGSEAAAEAAAEELLLRIIWHLKLAGIEAAQQRNPSSTISKDKLNIFIRGTWRTYDIFRLGTEGVATEISGLDRVFPEDPLPVSGIPD